MNHMHPTIAQAIAPFIPAPAGTLTLTPATRAAIAMFLSCKQAIMLTGGSDYIQHELKQNAVWALDWLLKDNPDATGLTAMLADVAAEIADENGEFAARREALALFGDAHNDRNKAGKAHLAQTLAALKLERQFEQCGVKA